MKNFLYHYLHDEHAVTAIEYAMAAVLIGLTAILVMRSVGNNLKNTFNHVSNNLT